MGGCLSFWSVSSQLSAFSPQPNRTTQRPWFNFWNEKLRLVDSHKSFDRWGVRGALRLLRSARHDGTGGHCEEQRDEAISASQNLCGGPLGALLFVACEG